MKIRLLLLILVLQIHSAKGQLYFPPLDNSLPWDTLSPASLGWCSDQVDSLYQYLQQEDTKAFIVLKDGKIVLERYFGTFTQDSIWYWASAGKTITSFLVGKAQEENLLSLNDKTSDYLGVGWTNCTTTQEDLITIRNQVTMTSGLDDGVADNHCTIDSCLVYLADAGTRWAYHNAPYTLLESVLENASGQVINLYTLQKLKNQTGMTGFWLTVDYDNVYYSKARSMARFGLLIQNDCIWNGDTLLHDTTYIHQMTNTSQLLNKSYGYLWWLNGKPSFMVPGSQFVFPGPLMPNAPSDMFAALGKNGQILSIAKSNGISFVRMGNQPTSLDVPFLLCDAIWEKLNAAMCMATSVEESAIENVSLYPNPAKSEIKIRSSEEINSVEIFDVSGRIVLQQNNSKLINIDSLPSGIYYIKVKTSTYSVTKKLVKE